ncbi:hypothetical protein DUNSADRAFT_17821 [Dunaliella salina]|uniref:Uncharacterized protein n=1 Tax=Dunaliella salina TaxID=3046 RepID=A0ABQ7GZP3_DUNSA|nr:hypothetical protein DUNSADRAFT_17821 [Dunaliella salina]|eukprot:KAF5840086.1 hypothetical protein DUNSADRAFT_17821 [Dunaliella salina]
MLAKRLQEKLRAKFSMLACANEGESTPRSKVPASNHVSTAGTASTAGDALPTSTIEKYDQQLQMAMAQQVAANSDIAMLLQIANISPLPDHNRSSTFLEITPYNPASLMLQDTQQLTLTAEGALTLTLSFINLNPLALECGPLRLSFSSLFLPTPSNLTAVVKTLSDHVFQHPLRAWVLRGQQDLVDSGEEPSPPSSSKAARQDLLLANLVTGTSLSVKEAAASDGGILAFTLLDMTLAASRSSSDALQEICLWPASPKSQESRSVLLHHGHLPHSALKGGLPPLQRDSQPTQGSQHWLLAPCRC